MSIATIMGMWGPIMATNGLDAASVIEAATLLKETQYQIFLLMNIVIVLIFVATCFFLWSLLDPIPAAMCSILMISGAYVVVYYGFATVRNFDPSMTVRQIIFPHTFLAEEKRDILAEQKELDRHLKVSVNILLNYE